MRSNTTASYAVPSSPDLPSPSSIKIRNNRPQSPLNCSARPPVIVGARLACMHYHQGLPLPPEISKVVRSFLDSIWEKPLCLKKSVIGTVAVAVPSFHISDYPEEIYLVQQAAQVLERLNKSISVPGKAQRNGQRLLLAASAKTQRENTLLSPCRVFQQKLRWAF